MKSKLLTISLFIFFCVCSITNVSAQLLLKENFEYAVGDSLCGQPTWDWMNVPTTTRNLILVQSDALTYTDYPASGVGNKVSLSKSGEDLYRTFPRQTSGTVYASFLVKVTQLPSTTGDYFFAFSSNPSNKSIFHGRVYVKKDASDKLMFGVVRSATANAAWTTASYDLNTTYLVVLKYEIISGALNDMCSIVVNPTIATEPSSWTTITGNSSGPEDTNLVGAVALRQGDGTNSAAVEISGIRVATSWTDLMNASATVQGIVLSTDDAIKTGFTATNASSSTEQSFKISGSNLTAGVVFTQIGTTKYFELSTDNITYQNEITLTPVDGILPETTVFIRMKSFATVGSYSNTFNITSTGVNTTYLKASGTTTLSTGLEQNALSPVVSVNNGILHVSGIQQGERIEVYNAVGQKIYSAIANETTCQITLNSRGLHIIKISKSISKIVL